MSSDIVAKLLHTINAHTSDVNGLAINKDTLASASGDKTVRLWSIDNFTELPSSPLCGHKYSVKGCIFSQQGNILLSYSTDGKCIFWDQKTGDKNATISHKSQASIRVCQFSPNEQLLITGSDDETLCLWEVVSKRLLQTYKSNEDSATAAAFSPNSAYVVSGTTNGDLMVWDSAFGHCKDLLFHPNAHDLGVTCIQFSPTYGSAGLTSACCASGPSTSKGGVDSRLATQTHFLLATSGFDEHVILWDFIAYSGSPKVQLQRRDVLTGHEGHVMQCSFSPNGKLLASVGSDHVIRLWDPLIAILLYSVDGHTRFITSCAFSLDGTLLATGSNDKLIKIWKIKQKDQFDDVVHYQDIQAALPSAPAKDPLRAWSVDAVCQWMCELGMSQYEERFRQHAIDGTELTTLTHDTLEHDLGISALGHRNKILRAVQHTTEHPEIQPNYSDDGVPDEYLCPITREIMREPVIASDGYTYERAAITAWMNSGKMCSPMTNAALPNTTVTPNRSLKMLIQRHLQQHQM